MQHQKSYLVFDLSSECSFGEGLGVYTSYELAIKAMQDRINDYSDVDTDIYLHCFSINLDDPICQYRPIANYSEGKWDISQQN
ncbi:MAG: hypothetical protein V7L21_29165 [Nostoc sp.]|uniref:hypothetical protein n=1 Tax=Nostoc sp. TaxID=1180 RepID=UPI002FF50071